MDSKSEISFSRYLFFGIALLIHCAFFGLFFHFRLFEGSIPFSPDYHSWLEIPFLLTLFCLNIFLLVVVFFIQQSRPNFAKNIGKLFFLITGIGTVMYLSYHFNYHNTPMVSNFKSWEKVTPYHVQLGELFFAWIMLANFSILFLKSLRLWLKVLNFIIPFVVFVFILNKWI